MTVRAVMRVPAHLDATAHPWVVTRSTKAAAMAVASSAAAETAKQWHLQRPGVTAPATAAVLLAKDNSSSSSSSSRAARVAEGGEAAGVASAHSRAAGAVVEWATGRATLLLVCAPRRGAKTRLYHPTTRMVQVNQATNFSASMGKLSLWTAASREQVCSCAFSSTNPPTLIGRIGHASRICCYCWPQDRDSLLATFAKPSWNMGLSTRMAIYWLVFSPQR